MLAARQELKPFWLIRYRLIDVTGLADDDIECGLVGSVTFCFFTYKLGQRPPEDGYAVHCYWEMQQNGLIDESNVQDNPAEYQSLTSQWRGSPLENIELLFVAEISPELRHPQRLVGLASASLMEQEGWVVFDGESSEWYPKAEMPADVFASVVLAIHVGRRLLGFAEAADRKKFLQGPKVQKSPEQVIGAYYKLLADAQGTDTGKQKDAFGMFSPLCKHLEKFADALEKVGHGSEIRAVVQIMAPHLEHVSGYSNLGNASLKCGQRDLAEQFFLKYRNQCTNYERGEEMASLENFHK